MDNSDAEDTFNESDIMFESEDSEYTSDYTAKTTYETL